MHIERWPEQKRSRDLPRVTQTSGFPDCFVAIVVPESGPPRCTYGDGSVLVTSR